MFDLFPLSPQIPEDIRTDIFSLQCYPMGILQPPGTYPQQTQPVTPDQLYKSTLHPPAEGPRRIGALTVIQRLGPCQQPPALIPIVPGFIGIRLVRLPRVTFPSRIPEEV